MKVSDKFDGGPVKHAIHGVEFMPLKEGLKMTLQKLGIYPLSDYGSVVIKFEGGVIVHTEVRESRKI